MKQKLSFKQPLFGKLLLFRLSFSISYEESLKEERVFLRLQQNRERGFSFPSPSVKSKTREGGTPCIFLSVKSRNDSTSAPSDRAKQNLGGEN